MAIRNKDLRGIECGDIQFSGRNLRESISMNDSVIAKAGVLGDLRALLASKGLSVEEVTQISDIPELVRQAEKPYLTPLSSPAFNDFTEKNVLWLVARRDGVPVYLGCARLEDLGTEAVGSFWRRVFARVYGDGQTEKISDVRENVDRSIGGRLVYFGDLYVSAAGRGDRAALRAFVALGHAAVSLKWDPDWTYCFVRERDALRGAALMYGFGQVMPRPFRWIDPPSPRTNSEWLAVLAKGELLPMISATRDALCDLDDKKREVQDVALVVS